MAPFSDPSIMGLKNCQSKDQSMSFPRLVSTARYLLVSVFLVACSQENASDTTVAVEAETAPATASSLETTAERAGYALGVNIGMGIQGQGFEADISIDSLVQGLRDTLAEDVKLSDEELMAAIQEFTALQESKFAAEMEEESSAQRDFLVENGAKEGVVTTPSGLQYTVLTEGPNDGLSPAATDTVNVHYHGTLIDGTVFDSSVDRGEPISFPLNGVIAGWTEGLQLMTVGDKYRFFIPSDLAYGPNGAGGVIGPNATLVFDVELLGIE
jgi:FKBP-type peptidyl-prolyl cis-trans isomerase